MKNLFFIAVCVLSSLFLNAQSDISNNILKDLRSSFNAEDMHTKAVTNSVTNNSISELALNRSNIGKTDHSFKYKVNVKGITNQKSSGRCWMFTSYNIIRPKVIDKYKLSSFEFSTNYLYFYDILEKSNLFLEGIIETRALEINDRKVEWLMMNVVGDGGVWSSFTNLVNKYGLVPKEAMPETNSSENTRMMIKLIRRKLREDAMELRSIKGSDDVLRIKKTEMLMDIYKLLAINLGEPPLEFEWRYTDSEGNISETKKYTPKSFMKKFVGEIDFNEFIMLMDDPSKPYYKLYEIQRDRNVSEGMNWRFINLPSGIIKQYALESIKNNEAMYFSCDVGKQLNKEEGLLDINNYDYESLFGVKFDMSKKERILTRESGSTHGMALIGVDIDKKGKITKWLLENSWGEKSGHNGYLTMTDEWFDQYMFRLVVLKKFMDDKTLNILEQEPILLQPWDPMFSEDE